MEKNPNQLDLKVKLQNKTSDKTLRKFLEMWTFTPSKILIKKIK